MEEKQDNFKIFINCFSGITHQELFDLIITYLHNKELHNLIKSFKEEYKEIKSQITTPIFKKINFFTILLMFPSGVIVLSIILKEIYDITDNIVDFLTNLKIPEVLHMGNRVSIRSKFYNYGKNIYTIPIIVPNHKYSNVLDYNTNFKKEIVSAIRNSKVKYITKDIIELNNLIEDNNSNIFTRRLHTELKESYFKKIRDYIIKNEQLNQYYLGSIFKFKVNVESNLINDTKEIDTHYVIWSDYNQTDLKYQEHYYTLEKTNISFHLEHNLCDIINSSQELYKKKLVDYLDELNSSSLYINKYYYTYIYKYYQIVLYPLIENNQQIVYLYKPIKIDPFIKIENIIEGFIDEILREENFSNYHNKIDNYIKLLFDEIKSVNVKNERTNIVNKLEPVYSNLLEYYHYLCNDSQVHTRPNILQEIINIYNKEFNSIYAYTIQNVFEFSWIYINHYMDKLKVQKLKNSFNNLKNRNEYYRQLSEHICLVLVNISSIQLKNRFNTIHDSEGIFVKTHNIQKKCSIETIDKNIPIEKLFTHLNNTRLNEKIKAQIDTFKFKKTPKRIKQQ